jgi:hypothetical protein
MLDLLCTLWLMILYEPLCNLLWNVQLEPDTVKSDEDSKVVLLDIIKWCLGFKV